MTYVGKEQMQTLVMHNQFSRYLETHMIHNHQLFIMSVTDGMEKSDLDDINNECSIFNMKTL